VGTHSEGEEGTHSESKDLIKNLKNHCKIIRCIISLGSFQCPLRLL